MLPAWLFNKVGPSIVLFDFFEYGQYNKVINFPWKQFYFGKVGLKVSWYGAEHCERTPMNIILLSLFKLSK